MLQDKNIQIVNWLPFFNLILFHEHKLFSEFAESLSWLIKSIYVKYLVLPRENHGKLSIQDLQKKIPGSEIKRGRNVHLKSHDDSVLFLWELEIFKNSRSCEKDFHYEKQKRLIGACPCFFLSQFIGMSTISRIFKDVEEVGRDKLPLTV